MKSGRRSNTMRRFPGLFLVLLLAALGATLAPAQVYIAYTNVGLISEYDQDTGALLNEQFILGLKGVHGLCVANAVLYVLQTDSGTIGTYNLQTGAPVRPELVTGLNQPQVMTVSGNAIYVSEFDWQTNQPHICKYNAFTGAAISTPLVKISSPVMNGMTMNAQQPNTLTAAGNNLFVGDGYIGVAEYDATTGTVINDKFVPRLFTSDFLLLDGKWLLLLAGSNSTMGIIFKIDTVAGPSSYPGGGPIPPPFMNFLDHPRLLALSGDDLILSQGAGTGVARYNATSGKLITADFIPSKGDFPGGLAVVPRPRTADETSTDSQIETTQSINHLLFMMAVFWQYTFFGTCLVLLLFVCAILAFLFWRRASATPAPAVVEPIAEKAPAPEEIAPAAPIAVEAPLPVLEEQPAPAEPAPTPASGPSALAIVALIVVGITLATAGVLIYFILVPPTGTGMPEPETDFIGVWSFDNNGIRQADETPVMRELTISPTHANYSEGNGPHDLTGQWRDNGFWIPNPDGTGETEVARLLDPLNMEVHVSAFYPGRSDVVTLYKIEGSAAEKQAIAAKYPPPLTYPPAKGVITYNMSEYDLNSLPWRVDYIEAVGETYSRGTLYHYRSDDPKIPPLEVTVKLHHVVEIHGGYE